MSLSKAPFIHAVVVAAVIYNNYRPLKKTYFATNSAVSMAVVRTCCQLAVHTIKLFESSSAFDDSVPMLFLRVSQIAVGAVFLIYQFSVETCGSINQIFTYCAFTHFNRYFNYNSTPHPPLTATNIIKSSRCNVVG